MLDFRFVILLLLLTHSSTSLPTNFFGAIRVIQHVCYNEISSGHVIEIVRIAYDFTLGISRLCIASLLSITKIGRGFNPDVYYLDR